MRVKLTELCPLAWRSSLEGVLVGAVGETIERRLLEETRAGHTYYPEPHRIFASLGDLAPASVRVVILGQDPYHGAGQATGRAFEVQCGQSLPPSLRNIRAMLARDVGHRVAEHFNIGNWSKQGVLLLNTVLTVRAGEPESHRSFGWQSVTDQIIEVAARDVSPTVFLLWGGHAQKKESLIRGPQNLILKAPHPSPLSAYRGFFECRHFSRANQWLTSHGVPQILWDSVE
ncbi:uracil-DNA glycosylase [Luminiphilus sp.]|nr:uracil-DNA glycosylase [Luminiphilus sp.]